jgi:4,5-DOPA dioxygenase extradiol
MIYQFPSLFISHGAPSYALAPGVAGRQLTALGRALPTPNAVLVVSPHWMTQSVRVAITNAPRTLHDFGGFDPELYKIQYAAPGHPALAQRTIDLLNKAGWHAEADSNWGLDHGAWVPLRYLFPSANVPVFQISMPSHLDAYEAVALGEALRPLSTEGVLIVGSGSLTHNLYEFQIDVTHEAAYAHEFTSWVQNAVDEADLDRLTQTMQHAPHAKRAHPSAEHFLPLLIAAGAAKSLAPSTVLQGGIAHGVLSMESYLFGQSVSINVHTNASFSTLNAAALELTSSIRP